MVENINNVTTSFPNVSKTSSIVLETLLGNRNGEKNKTELKYNVNQVQTLA